VSFIDVKELVRVYRMGAVASQTGCQRHPWDGTKRQQWRSSWKLRTGGIRAF
jgi:hypothetical protein